jgi:hypothetical protein
MQYRYPTCGIEYLTADGVMRFAQV